MTATPIRHYQRTLVGLCNELRRPGYDIAMAEIGVWRGETSAYLLANVPDLKLMMVDTWQAIPPKSWRKALGGRMYRLPQQEFNDAHFEAIRVTQMFQDRRRIEHKSSLEAAQMVLNETADLVFLDAMHTRRAVLNDILAWWPKIRHGGILCGHDYDSRNHRGVKRAVDHWCKNMGFTPYVYPGKVWTVSK